MNLNNFQSYYQIKKKKKENNDVQTSINKNVNQFLKCLNHQSENKFNLYYSFESFKRKI